MRPNVSNDNFRGDRTVQSLFNRIAPIYDPLNDRLSLGQHRVWKQMAVKWSQAKTGDICLDLCCGSGDLAFLLARKAGKTGQVYGVDFSSELLAIAASRHQHQFPHFPIHWVEADALDLPFADEFFHSTTLGYGLRNVSNIPQCLKEVYRVLKPGGTAAILDFHRPYQPLLQTFQQWYLDTLVVPTAQQFGVAADYEYITPSLNRFPQGQQQVELAHHAGFSQATHYPIVGGMMGVLVISKGLS